MSRFLFADSEGIAHQTDIIAVNKSFQRVAIKLYAIAQVLICGPKTKAALPQSSNYIVNFYQQFIG